MTIDDPSAVPQSPATMQKHQGQDDLVPTMMASSPSFSAATTPSLSSPSLSSPSLSSHALPSPLLASPTTPVWSGLGFLAAAAASATSPTTEMDLTKKRIRAVGSSAGRAAVDANTTVLPTRRRKRDPALPKRATTAFVMFAAERRPSVLKQNPGISFADVGRMLGIMWAEMSAEERLPFEQLVQLDRQRYEREMDTYLRDYQLRCQERLAASFNN